MAADSGAHGTKHYNRHELITGILTRMPGGYNKNKAAKADELVENLFKQVAGNRPGLSLRALEEAGGRCELAQGNASTDDAKRYGDIAVAIENLVKDINEGKIIVGTVKNVAEPAAPIRPRPQPPVHADDADDRQDEMETPVAARQPVIEEAQTAAQPAAQIVAASAQKAEVAPLMLTINDHPDYAKWHNTLRAYLDEINPDDKPELFGINVRQNVLTELEEGAAVNTFWYVTNLHQAFLTNGVKISDDALALGSELVARHQAMQNDIEAQEVPSRITDVRKPKITSITEHADFAKWQESGYALVALTKNVSGVDATNATIDELAEKKPEAAIRLVTKLQQKLLEDGATKPETIEAFSKGMVEFIRLRKTMDDELRAAKKQRNPVNVKDHQLYGLLSEVWNEFESLVNSRGGIEIDGSVVSKDLFLEISEHCGAKGVVGYVEEMLDKFIDKGASKLDLKRFAALGSDFFVLHNMIREDVKLGKQAAHAREKREAAGEGRAA